MIKTLHLKNFAAFKDLRIDLSPGINILLGENGTGKTQLLKAAYGAAHAVGMHQHPPQNGGAPVQRHITSKLLRIFSPASDGLQDLRHAGGGKGKSTVSVLFDNSASFEVAFNGASDMVAVNAKGELEAANLRAVYIPSKEVLSFVKGILQKKHDPRTVQMIFDDCALDLVEALQRPDGHEKVAAALARMQEIGAEMSENANSTLDRLDEGNKILGLPPKSFRLHKNAFEPPAKILNQLSPDELLERVRGDRVRLGRARQNLSDFQKRGKIGQIKVAEAEASGMSREDAQHVSQVINDVVQQAEKLLCAREDILNATEEYAQKMAAQELNPRYNAMVTALVNLVGGTYQWADGQLSFQSGAYEGGSAEPLRALLSGTYDDYTPAKFKPGGAAPYGIAMIAEGFRKIGMLHRLISNETLSPDSGALLLWDEPEANLNPYQMKTVVSVLLALSRNGHQIILATHDYATVKWFELLLDEGQGDKIRYHSLERDGDDIAVRSVNDYSQVQDNPILKAYSEIYDAEIDRAFSVGKRA